MVEWQKMFNRKPTAYMPSMEVQQEYQVEEYPYMIPTTLELYECNSEDSRYFPCQFFTPYNLVLYILNEFKADLR